MFTLTHFLTSLQRSSAFKQKPATGKVSLPAPQVTQTDTTVLLAASLQTLLPPPPPFSEPSVEFLEPLEQVEVRVGEQARLHCQFRSSSVPVACCWIHNRDKVGGVAAAGVSSEPRAS